MSNVNASRRRVNYTCPQCGHRGPPEHFRDWLLDVEAGIATQQLCQVCRKPKPVDYERRNRFLKVLGFNSYSHYLNSEMWNTIRNMVLKRDGGKCVRKGCGRLATNVHHNSYEMDVLIGKDIRQLVSLCRTHHEEAEFDRQGQKRDLPKVRLVLQSAGVWMPAMKHVPLNKCLPPRRREEPPSLRKMRHALNRYRVKLQAVDPSSEKYAKLSKRIFRMEKRLQHEGDKLFSGRIQ